MLIGLGFLKECFTNSFFSNHSSFSQSQFFTSDLNFKALYCFAFTTVKFVIQECNIIRCTFLHRLEKIKNIYPEKNPLYFRKWTFLTLILKEFVYFLKRKLSLYFRKWNPVAVSPEFKNKKQFPPRKFFYFRKRKPRKKLLCFLRRKLFLYFRKRKPRKNSLYLRKKSFLLFQETETLKNFLYFRKWNFLSPSLKDFLYFRKEFPKPENQKFPILFLIKKKHFRN